MCLGTGKNCSNFARHLPLDLDVGIFWGGFFHNLACISGKTDLIFIKILLFIYPWRKESPLNFGGHLVLDLGSGSILYVRTIFALADVCAVPSALDNLCDTCHAVDSGFARDVSGGDWCLVLLIIVNVRWRLSSAITTAAFNDELLVNAAQTEFFVSVLKPFLLVTVLSVFCIKHGCS